MCSLSPRPAREKDEKFFPYSPGLGVPISEVGVANVEKQKGCQSWRMYSRRWFRGSVNISGTRCLRHINMEMGDNPKPFIEDTFVYKSRPHFCAAIGRGLWRLLRYSAEMKCSSQNQLCSFAYNREKTKKFSFCVGWIDLIVCAKPIFSCSSFYFLFFLFSLQPTVAHICRPCAQLNSDGWLQCKVSYKTDLVHITTVWRTRV